MKARWHWMAYDEMITPSINWCGSPSTSMWSLKVDGSPSSPLTARYRGKTSFGRKDHFWPVPKPAPPRPRRPDVVTSVTMSAGAIVSALRSASYAPFCSAASIVKESSGRPRRNLVTRRSSSTATRRLRSAVPCRAHGSTASLSSGRASARTGRLQGADRSAGDRARDAVAALVRLDELDRGVAGERTVELVVHLQHRREVA